jgi:hypothetical protein
MVAALLRASGGDQIALDEFSYIRGIEQSRLDEDAGSEKVVLHIGVNNVAVKGEAEDLDLH